MIEIPDLSQLNLDGHLSPRSHYSVSSIGGDLVRPNTTEPPHVGHASLSPQPRDVHTSALAEPYIAQLGNVSTDDSTDDYAQDLRTYRFGHSTIDSDLEDHTARSAVLDLSSRINLASVSHVELNTAQAVSVTQSPQPKLLLSPQALVIKRNPAAAAGADSAAAVENHDATAHLEDPIQFYHQPTTLSDSPIVTQTVVYDPSPQLPPPPIPSTPATSKLNHPNEERYSSIRKDLATDPKTPAEYTLHILFTQFVRHAERKLNLCLDFPLNEEPPIIQLLAEGVDTRFDRIIALLGYIARRKPSPVIDSVMFWRKSKSEVASMAALEVERAIQNSRQYSHTQNQLLVLTQLLIGLGIGAPAPPLSMASTTASSQLQQPSKVKRSLSLMRSKSISKFAHKRNHSNASTANSVLSQTNATSAAAANNASGTPSMAALDISQPQIAQARVTAVQADTKSLALIYILCRVLIEVVKQTPTEVMREELGTRLEEIVYTQMKTTDPISTGELLVRSANWNLFAQLLGYMSENQFVSVSDRFIADLEKVPPHITPAMESRLHLLIHGMKYLKLTNYPLEKFEELAEFMQSLGKFFSKSMNESLIYAYCEVLSNLVLPLANILTAETNHPTWVEAIESIFNKASQVWSHNMKLQQSATLTATTGGSGSASRASAGWSYAISLMTSMLSVSRKELFARAWFELIEENLIKFKPKVDVAEKTTLLICITRLSWVYLYRLPDSLNNTVKKLDTLFGCLFFNSSVTGKKLQWINSTNEAFLRAMVMLLSIVGYQHLNYTLDNVLIRLLKLCFNGVSLEGASYERLIIVVKGYVATIRAYERGVKPAFPTDDVFTGVSDTSLELPINNASSPNGDDSSSTISIDKFNFLARNANNSVSHEEICKSFAQLLQLLDHLQGADIWQPENVLVTPMTLRGDLLANAGTNGNNLGQNTNGTSLNGSGFFHFGLDFSDQSSKESQLKLFAAVVEAIPWTLVPLGSDKNSPSGVPLKNVVEILARNAMHKDVAVARACVSSLKKLATRNLAPSLIAIFAKISFQLSDKLGPNYNLMYLNLAEFHRLLKIYVELLTCWLGQFHYMKRKQELNSGHNASNKTDHLNQDDEMMNQDVLNDLYQVNYKADDLTFENVSKLKPSDELEWKNIITVIEEVEGNGLFFLCSQDSQTRQLGIYILKLVEQFDQAIYNITDTPKSSTATLPASPEKESQSPERAKTHSRSSSKFAADVGTRLIHILEDIDFLELIKPFKNEISHPERLRLAKLRNKKHILVKLGESDYGIDSTLWFRLFPKILDIFFEKCPMPVALCRAIVCVRIVQMHEFVVEFAETRKNNTLSFFNRSNASNGGTPPEVIIDQWKLYLIFAACSLTSTNEQKISFPNQPTHGRKRLMQMYIQHQKITSAKSVFRMVFPLLNSHQPMVRDAVITGLSCININIFRSLLENLPDAMRDWDITSGKKRDSSEDKLRIETIHILSNVTNKFQSRIEDVYCDEWIVASAIQIIKSVKNFLNLPAIQTDLDFQKLRRYFCQLLENVYVGIMGVSGEGGLNRWIPFEARLGCFNYLKEWCSYGDTAELSEERYNAMMAKIAQRKDSQPLATAILEVERKALQISSLNCMSKLCSGPLVQELDLAGKSAVLSFDIHGLQEWIHALFCTDIDFCHEVGKKALRNILRSNADNNEIVENVIFQCYTSHESTRTTESYLTVFAEVFMEQQQQQLLNDEGSMIKQVSSRMNEDPNEVCSLASLLIGRENYETRVAAMKLLMSLENYYYNSHVVDRYVECVCSRAKVVYKKAMFDLSLALANAHPDVTYERISYLTKFFNFADHDSRRDILSCLLPWIQIIELKYKDESKEEDDAQLMGQVPMPPKSSSVVAIHVKHNLDAPSMMILNNLFELTVKFSSEMLNELEALWVALGSKNSQNFDMVVEYIVSNCLERKNPLFVDYSRQIIDYLAFSHVDVLLYITDKFVGNLHPKAMVPPPPQSRDNLADLAEFDMFPYVANLWKLVPYHGKDATFSLGQLSLIFLVDIFSSHGDRIVENLPLLLHVALSLLDHYLYIVQEQAGSLLIHLINALTTSEDQQSPKVKETLNILRKRDNVKHLWVYDDLSNDVRRPGSKDSGRTPKNMDLLVRNILEILAPVVQTLQHDWSRVSLSWATTCAVRHIACRSFQIFRSLLSFLDQGMLRDMLHRLSNTISDDSVEIQGFAMQILMTLNAITAELDSKKLIDFPQLFWSSVACLSTIHEQEFIEVLSTMSKFVSKIDLDAPDTVSCLISTFPPKWEGKFEGLQQIVMIGLRSAAAWDPLLKFLDKMNELQDSEIIGMGDSRLLMAMLANMPRILHALEQKNISSDLEKTCLLLSKMSDANAMPSLSRILVSLGKNRFRSKRDFLNQMASTLKVLFFPRFEAQALVFLLGLLSNKIGWVKTETMNLLKYIFPIVDLTRDEFLGVGADLISPLLRLLLTDYAEPALEVLDEVITISGSQMDKDVLRMSLGNVSMKKEYEKTATLFGIPEESGWAIPMPAVTASSTRNNVHAVFSTCVTPQTRASADVTEHPSQNFIDEKNALQQSRETLANIAPFVSGDGVDSHDDNEDIQFHMEDYHVPVGDQNDGELITVGEPDASLSNMWAALDDFDSFLTRDNTIGPVNALSGSGSGHTLGYDYETNVDNVLNSLSKSPTSSRTNGMKSYYQRDQYAQHHLRRPQGKQTHHHGHSASVDTKHSNNSDISPMDSAPLVYDKKASVILNRSLARSHSNASFKSSLADSMGETSISTAFGASPALNKTPIVGASGSGSIVVAKRSYLPFRHSRTVVSKASSGSMGSPRSPTTLEAGEAVSPYRTPRIGSPTGNEPTFFSLSLPIFGVSTGFGNINAGGPAAAGNLGNITPTGVPASQAQADRRSGSPRVDHPSLPFDSVVGRVSKKRSRNWPKPPSSAHSGSDLPELMPKGVKSKNPSSSPKAPGQTAAATRKG